MNTTKYFDTKEEYEKAVADFQEANKDLVCLPANDPINFTEGVLFLSRDEENDDAHFFHHKYAKGYSKIVLYKSFKRWVNAIEKCKQKYKEDLVPVDDPKNLQIGYLCVSAKKAMRIHIQALRTLKLNASVINAVFNDPEEREKFGKYQGKYQGGQPWLTIHTTTGKSLTKQ